MNNEILVSVILPIYNVENYIEQCVNSICEQTYTNLEIILVDDGSPDNCPLICDRYARKDTRVKVIHKKNGGLVSAWITGLMNSTSEYIVFIDPDDWISPRYIEIMVEVLKKTSADVISCSLKKVWNNKETIHKPLILGGFYDRNKLINEFYPKFLNAGDFQKRSIAISRGGKLISKQLLVDNIRYSDKRVTYAEDLNIMFPVLLDAQSLYVVDDMECIYYYRYNPKSMLNAYDKNMLYSIEYVHPALLKICDEKNHPEMKKQVYADFLAAAVQYFKNELQNPGGINCTITNIKEFVQKPMVKDAIDIVEWKHYKKINTVIISCMQNYNFWNQQITTRVLKILKLIDEKIKANKGII